MSFLSGLSALSTSFLTLGLSASLSSVALAQTSFPDVPSDYWAEPFINRLAQRNIIAGYPDGTFRPEQAVQRDEFAAMIRQAFDQEPVREIESGSAYEDVPEGYWAEQPIEEAAQQGFMSGDAGGNFRPNQPMSRVEALTTLVRGLNLAPRTAQTNTRRATRRPIYLPLAVTSLMQPIVAARPATPPVTTPVAEPLAETVREYYTDADQIPDSAIPYVGIATQRNLVVNHPDLRVLNPNEPLRRATAAAFIHQSLVAQDRIEPLPSNVAAYNYIVRPEISQAAR
ncbi:MAG: S-layer homology domain-containing protein [Nostoc sp. LLA-1]|nr:S-layer homology domain-containing protein [Cyanocohniella sp. LLY]